MDVKLNDLDNLDNFIISVKNVTNTINQLNDKIKELEKLLDDSNSIVDKTEYKYAMDITAGIINEINIMRNKIWKSIQKLQPKQNINELIQKQQIEILINSLKKS